MTRLDDTLTALQEFAPTGDESDDTERLETILAPLPDDPATAAALAPALLALAERHPAAALGTPGPLVHRLDGAQDLPALLRASLLRAPAELTAWMANRLLNTRLDRERRADWLAVLAEVAANQAAAPAVRASANEFLDFQASRPSL